MVNKPLTPEEAENWRATIVKKTLESKVMQGASAVTSIRNDPYTHGSAAYKIANSQYGNVVFSSEANEVRKQMYNKTLEGYQKAGRTDLPQIGDNDVLYGMSQQVAEVTQFARVGELYNICKKLSGKLDDMPNEFKEIENISLAELREKYTNPTTKKFDPKQMSKTDKLANDAIVYLSEMYQRACVVNLVKGSTFDDLVGGLDKIKEELKGNPEQAPLALAA